MDYYRVYAKVNLDAISNNINAVKQKVSRGTMVMAVVKANAYGHGAVNVAKHLENDVDYFGVADIFEALELRKHSIKKPILLLGFTAPDMHKIAIENDITVTVFDLSSAKNLSEIAGRLNKTAKIHIALDTGMSRIGYTLSDENINQIKQIYALENIYTEGIFSHYATADEKDKRSALKQKELFLEFINRLQSEGVRIPIKHLSNSAGIMEMSTDFNMVRAGIITYGLYPSDEVDKKELKITPAMQIITHVTFIKQIKKGDGVSYGLTFKADKDITVATLPIGYADGYPRALSNKAHVLINGKKCKVLGRICMDQMMVDVTNVRLNVLDEVVVVGEGVSVESLCEMAGTFNYEFVCRVSRRVPRLYFKNGKFIGEVNYLN